MNALESKDGLLSAKNKPAFSNIIHSTNEDGQNLDVKKLSHRVASERLESASLYYEVAHKRASLPDTDFIDENKGPIQEFTISDKSVIKNSSALEETFSLKRQSNEVKNYDKPLALYSYNSDPKEKQSNSLENSNAEENREKIIRRSRKILVSKPRNN